MSNLQKQTRDPRLDPRVCDVLVKVSAKTGKTARREVTDRQNNEIIYRDHLNTLRQCWITSWQEWARLAEIEGQEQNPTNRLRNLILGRVGDMTSGLLIPEWPVADAVDPEKVAEALKSELVSETELIGAFRSALRKLIDTL